MTVYPNTADVATVRAQEFFSPIPRGVYDLRRQGKLQARDVDVLGLLLDYKGRTTTQVDPRQDTLAARLACSVDTIQRSLGRLARAGLIVKIRIRNAVGRLGRCVYDLAGTLSLMPHHAARMRSGGWGKPKTAQAIAVGADQLSSAVTTIPQKCGVTEADLKEVVKADSNSADTTAAATSPGPRLDPVVDSLRSFGVVGRVAVTLVERFGAERCRRQIAALPKRKAKDPAAVIVAAVQGDWSIPCGVDIRPPRQPQRRPAAPLPAAPDPLDLQPPAELARLEAAARAQLITETRNVVRHSLQNGRSHHLVRSRMRVLLAHDTALATTATA